ncbi:MAG: hypothetical protein IJB53_03415 [Mailhella sp.]|nr:hypothetical protein [Mailhella sp.]
MLPKIFRRLFQNEGYGKLLNKEIIPSDITVDGMVRFDAWRKSLIGCLFYLPTTTLPADYGVADGSLFLFEDFPELGEKYESGGFAGLLLNFDASDEDKNAYPGKWIPDAANPTGLYAPRLTDLFIQNSGTADAGKYVAAGLPEITGSTLFSYTALTDNRTADGAFRVEYSSSANTPGWQDAKQSIRVRFSASLSNPTYSASPTVQPPAVKLCPAVYLGRFA